MAKRVWKDRIVERPRTFKLQNADGTVTLVPAPGTIIQEGTPVNAANLNGIEQSIVEASQVVDNTTGGKYKWGIENGLVFLEKVVV
jgi:hypothetical protein